MANIKCSHKREDYLLLQFYFFSDQSKFLNASKILKNPDTEKDMVKVLEYHVAETYAEKVYKSCADVVNPSTSGTPHFHLI